jgi:hypothetical protein
VIVAGRYRIAEQKRSRADGARELFSKRFLRGFVKDKTIKKEGCR